MHFKRKTIGKFWPIPRKGTKYVAVPRHNKYESVPLIIFMRDVLRIVKTTKELKKLLNENQICINHKIVKEVNYPITLFDILSFPLINKNYKATLSKNKKLVLKEISEDEASIRVYKIINKKTINRGLVQLNLMSGRNILSKEKANVGDSILFDLKKNKVLKVIPLEKDRTIFVIRGKHAGAFGKIDEIFERGGKKIVKINNGKINVWIKNLVVIE